MMKRLFIIFFIIGGFISAQDAGDLPTKSTLESTDILFVNDLDTDTTYSSTLSNLALFMFSYDRVMSANFSITGTIQLPSTLNATLARGVGYNAGAFSYVEGSAIKDVADQAWVLQMIADSGVAVDTNAFGLLAGNQTWTGTNVYNLFKVGASTNSGNLKIPVYTSSTPSSISGAFYYDATNNKLKIYDSGWRTFLDSTGTVALITTGSYLPQTGTMTGLSSSLTWGSGTITPYKLSFGGHDDGRSLILPLDKNRVVLTSEGSTFWDYNYTKNIGVYDNAGTIVWFLNEDNIQTKIENHFGFSAPTTVSNADYDTLYFTDRNYIAVDYISIPEDGTTIYLSNSAYGAVQITIAGTDNTVNFFPRNGLGQSDWGDIRWDHGVAPTYETGTNRTYDILFRRQNATVILGSWSWSEPE